MPILKILFLSFVTSELDVVLGKLYLMITKKKNHSHICNCHGKITSIRIKMKKLIIRINIDKKCYFYL